MASVWKRALVYLGLVDEEDNLEPIRPMMDSSDEPQGTVRALRPDSISSVRTLEPDRPGPVESEVRTLGPNDVPSTPSEPARRIPSISVVEPDSFKEAQEIGDRLKQGIPVVVNLAGANAETAKRILDFASGSTYALGGHMERVGDRVFLLTPADVEVSPEETRRLIADRGFFGQF